MRSALPWLPLLAAALARAAEPNQGPTIVEAPARVSFPVALVAFVDDRVEQATAGGAWAEVGEGARLKTGDRLRTGARGTARVDFPWASVLLSSSSVLSVPSSLVLSTVLEEGRVEQRAEGGEIIKLRTAEAQVRGEGLLVARREHGVTLLTVLEGNFKVEAGGQAITLRRGQGTAIRPGTAPSPALSLPPPPGKLVPGSDPVYVVPGQKITLSWSPTGPAHHLQILGIDSEQVLISRDVGAGPAVIEIPWVGTFRWRVAARNEIGLEGPSSLEGLICVVEK